MAGSLPNLTFIAFTDTCCSLFSMSSNSTLWLVGRARLSCSTSSLWQHKWCYTCQRLGLGLFWVFCLVVFFWLKVFFKHFGHCDLLKDNKKSCFLYHPYFLYAMFLTGKEKLLILFFNSWMVLWGEMLWAQTQSKASFPLWRSGALHEHCWERISQDSGNAESHYSPLAH